MDTTHSYLDIGLRFLAVCASAYISARILVAVLDPNKEQRKAAEKSVAFLMKSLGIKTNLNLNEHELIIATQLVKPSDIDKCWSDIGGQDELIKEIGETLILPLRLKRESGLKCNVGGLSLLTPPKGILLYGPPGCGKTLIAKALAKSTGARFINFQFSTLADKWYGESQKLTAALFSLAKKLQPVIIFIDEIDAFMRARNFRDHECTAMVKAQFMSLWDGFASDSSTHVIIVGATNRPNDVDGAILRRMPARFKISPPNAMQREQILEVILRDTELERCVNLTEVADKTDGFSGSDLKEVCRIAAINRIKQLTDEEVNSFQDAIPLRLVDLLDGVEKIRQTLHLDQWARAQEAIFG